MKKLIQMTSLMVAAAGLVLAPVASAHGKHDMHPKQERMHEKAKPQKMKKPAPKEAQTSSRASPRTSLR